MERRLFVKKTSLLASGILAFSTETILATANQNKVNSLDLTPILAMDKKIIIKGFILDSKTHLPIFADINVKTKRNRYYSTKHTLTATNGSYSIVSGFSKVKLFEKMNIEIKVEGYKSYQGNLYVTRRGCNIHSDEWKYNPNFKPEYCPLNHEEENIFISKFNFYLVKTS